MKLTAERWMLVSPQKEGKPIVYSGFACVKRKDLIRKAEFNFFGGTTWARIRKSGWQAKRVKVQWSWK